MITKPLSQVGQDDKLRLINLLHLVCNISKVNKTNFQNTTLGIVSLSYVTQKILPVIFPKLALLGQWVQNFLCPMLLLISHTARDNIRQTGTTMIGK